MASIVEGRPSREQERQEAMASMVVEENAVFSRQFFPEFHFEILPDLGSRLQKFWYLRRRMVGGRYGIMLQITVVISRQCPTKLDQEKVPALKQLLEYLKHPFLLPVYDVACNDEAISFLIEYVESGSLRDRIFMTKPDKDWAEKYCLGGGKKSFSKEEIAKCGYQVLKAVEVLYDLGFSHIGQIHSGNVFMISGNYVLGGYENSLLGFRTSMYQDILREELLDKIDIIMFGCLLYEMCTSQPLKGVFPEESDYENILDPELRKIIKFIFDTARRTENCKKLMRQIALHSFFQRHPSWKQTEASPIELPAEAKQLLSIILSAGLKLDTIIENLHGKYDVEVHLPQLGWRHEKMWAKVRHTKLKMKGLLTAFVVPQECPVYVGMSMAVIRKLLLLKHDFLFNIRDIDHVVVDGQHIIVIFQDMIEKGSLRDVIYQVPPTAAHAIKYKSNRNKMKADQVALYGTQILQAMYFLSHLDQQDSPLTLGYVHTGNIFLDGHTCRLGGFENTLLGCQPRRLPLFEMNSANMDAYMFGHVIFEMSTGRELLTAVPKMEDYREVPRKLHQAFQYIFETDTVNYVEIVEQLQVVTTHSIEVDLMGRDMMPLDYETLFVLEKVRKGKKRDQGSHLEIGKHELKTRLHKLKKKFLT